VGLSDPVRPAWHTLFAPLPSDAVPRRRPVAPPEILAAPTGSAIAGWEQISLDLSAGADGLRVVLVVLDADGVPLSASDAVLYRTGPDGASPSEDGDAPAVIHQESVGGRFEPDGSFRGTRWHSVAVDPGGGSDELQWESTPSEPSASDVAGLRAMVADLMRRQPRPDSPTA
jgi:hypothetical protein